MRLLERHKWPKPRFKTSSERAARGLRMAGKRHTADCQMAPMTYSNRGSTHIMHAGRLPALLTGLTLLGGITASHAISSDPGVLVVERVRGTPLASYREADLAQVFAYLDITTQTPWTNGEKRTYRGFSLLEILKKNGLADAKVVIGIAPNDFAARIDMREIQKYRPIVASQIACNATEAQSGACTQGKMRSLETEDFGPFFIVWPYEELPQSFDPSDHSRWVWFLSELQPDQ